MGSVEAQAAVGHVIADIIVYLGLVPEDKLWLTLALCKPCILLVLTKQHERSQIS